MPFIKRIWNWLVQVNMITPLSLATTELEAAERALLSAQTATEYATSIVTYNQTRIARLRKYINALTKEQEK